MGVHLALGIWKQQLASVPVGLRMDSCFPSRYKLHGRKRRWELWGSSRQPPPQQKIGSALDLRMSLLSNPETWLDPRWHGQMPRRMHHHLYCWEGWWSPGRARGPFFMLDCSRQHFSFRFVQALAEAFTTKCDLQSKDPIYFSPPSLEETSLWGRKKKKRKDEKGYLYFLS